MRIFTKYLQPEPESLNEGVEHVLHDGQTGPGHVTHRPVIGQLVNGQHEGGGISLNIQKEKRKKSSGIQTLYVLL